MAAVSYSSTVAVAKDEDDFFYEEFPRMRDVEATIRAIATINRQSDVWNNLYRTYSSILDFFEGVVNDIEKKNGRDVSRRYQHQVSKCRKTRDVLRKEKCASKIMVEFCKSVVSSANSVFRLCIRKKWDTTVKHIRSSAPPCRYSLKKVVRCATAAAQEREATASSGASAAPISQEKKKKPSLFKTASITKGTGKEASPPYMPKPIAPRTEEEKKLVYNPTPIREAVPAAAQREASAATGNKKRKAAEEEEGPNKKIRSQQKEVAAATGKKKRREEVAVCSASAAEEGQIRSQQKEVAAATGKKKRRAVCSASAAEEGRYCPVTACFSSGNGITTENIKTIFQEYSASLITAIGKKSQPIDWRSQMKETAKIAARTADSDTAIVEKLEESLANYIVDFLVNDISREAKRLLLKHYRGEENDLKAIEAECTWRANRVTASAADSVAKAAVARDEAARRERTTPIASTSAASTSRQVAVGDVEKKRMPAPPKKKKSTIKKKHTTALWKNHTVPSAAVDRLEKNQAIFKTMMHHVYNERPREEIQRWQRCDEVTDIPANSIDAGNNFDLKNPETDGEGVPAVRGGIASNMYPKKNVRNPATAFERYAVDLLFTCFIQKNDKKNLCKAFQTAVDGGNQQRSAKSARTYCLNNTHTAEFLKAAYENTVRDDHRSDKLRNLFHAPIDLANAKTRATLNEVLYLGADPVLALARGCFKHVYNGRVMDENNCRMPLDIYLQLAAACQKGLLFHDWKMPNRQADNFAPEVTGDQDDNLYLGKKYGQHLAKLGLEIWGKLKEGQKMVPYLMLNDTAEGSSNVLYPSLCYYEGERLMGAIKDEHRIPATPRGTSGGQPFNPDSYFIISDDEDDDDEEEERDDDGLESEPVEQWEKVLNIDGNKYPPELLTRDDEESQRQGEEEEEEEEEQETGLPKNSPSFLGELNQLYIRSRIAKEQEEKKAMDRRQEEEEERQRRRKQKEEEETMRRQKEQEEEEARRRQMQKEREEQAKQERDEEEKVEETGLETPANNDIDTIIYEHMNGFSDEITVTEPLPETNFPLIPNQIQETNSLGLFAQQVDDYLADLSNILEQGVPPTPPFTGHHHDPSPQTDEHLLYFSNKEKDVSELQITSRKLTRPVLVSGTGNRPRFSL